MCLSVNVCVCLSVTGRVFNSVFLDFEKLPIVLFFFSLFSFQNPLYTCFGNLYVCYVLLGVGPFNVGLMHMHCTIINYFMVFHT